MLYTNGESDHLITGQRSSLDGLLDAKNQRTNGPTRRGSAPASCGPPRPSLQPLRVIPELPAPRSPSPRGYNRPRARHASLPDDIRGIFPTVCQLHHDAISLISTLLWFCTFILERHISQN